MEVEEYLSSEEDMRRRELVWGVVREPAAPFFGHQTVVGRAFALLDHYVREQQLGVVCVAPADVVLDRAKALVVQPDVFFISQARTAIVRDQVWGAPDLVVEVVSRATARHDATTKLGWYETYGVRECWLLYPAKRIVTVVTLGPGGRVSRTFSGEDRVASAVLPEFAAEASEFFS